MKERTNESKVPFNSGISNDDILSPTIDSHSTPSASILLRFSVVIPENLKTIGEVERAIMVSESDCGQSSSYCASRRMVPTSEVKMVFPSIFKVILPTICCGRTIRSGPRSIVPTFPSRSTVSS